MQHTQPALPLIWRGSERVTIPARTPIIATTDPAKPPYNRSTVSATVVAFVRQPDGTDWVWWQAAGGYMKAAVWIDGGLPVLLIPRRPKPKAKDLCRQCGRRLPRRRPEHMKYCSAECRKQVAKLKRDANKARRKPCRIEGCNRLGCRKHYPRSYHKRAAYWGVPYEPVSQVAIYERDGWVCGLCGLPVDKSLKWPDPMSVSLDHIIPMSKGGGHLWDQVQCSHLGCNMRKSNKTDLVSLL